MCSEPPWLPRGTEQRPDPGERRAGLDDPRSPGNRTLRAGCGRHLDVYEGDGFYSGETETRIRTEGLPTRPATRAWPVAREGQTQAAGYDECGLCLPLPRARRRQRRPSAALPTRVTTSSPSPFVFVAPFLPVKPLPPYQRLPLAAVSYRVDGPSRRLAVEHA